MTSTVAILGASGVYGRHLTPRLVAAGYTVRALVRRPEAAGVARGCGAEVRIADIFDLDSLRQGLEGCDVCINLATALPGPSGRGDYDLNDQVRREGVPLLLQACREAGVGRLLQQSIAMVGAEGDRLTDEDTAHRPEGDDISARAINATLDMEAAVRAADLDWLILRGGLFYGPGTGFDDDWFARAAAGKLRLPGDGSDFVSLIHIADMAAATVEALRAWPSRQILIVADDRPARWRDVFGYITGLAGGESPLPGGRAGFPSFRVSNRRAREALGWNPVYPDYRAGLVR
ncbi:MAG: NAD(P)-dependent oxidoreductase [Caulobacter sp.]|nr:NAD(P)-dependent oxidoreductase [Caulobacter sp.]